MIKLSFQHFYDNLNAWYCLVEYNIFVKSWAKRVPNLRYKSNIPKATTPPSSPAPGKRLFPPTKYIKGFSAMACSHWGRLPSKIRLKLKPNRRYSSSKTSKPLSSSSSRAVSTPTSSSWHKTLKNWSKPLPLLWPSCSRRASLTRTSPLRISTTSKETLNCCLMSSSKTALIKDWKMERKSIHPQSWSLL